MFLVLNVEDISSSVQSEDPMERNSLAIARIILKQALEKQKKNKVGASGFTLSSDDFYKLVGALSNLQELDEEFYVATHKDIAKAIQSGAYKSARDHFDKGGFLEGRVGTLEGFDPEAYYDLNKDLHKAYSRSDSKALTEHYIKFGFAEGRKISKDQI